MNHNFVNFKKGDIAYAFLYGGIEECLVDETVLERGFYFSKDDVYMSETEVFRTERETVSHGRMLNSQEIRKAEKRVDELKEQAIELEILEKSMRR